jgi:hypothetical protein
MTEQQWTDRHAPSAMLDHVLEAASPRKLRLFACACCRLVWDLLDDDRPRRAVEVAERFADRLVKNRERQQAQQAAWEYSDEQELSPESVAAGWAIVRSQRSDLLKTAAVVCSHNTRCVKGRNITRAQAHLLRELFGNPFRAAPVVPPAVLGWNGWQVVKLARAIYAERRFDDLPVLADALEEAGCEEEAMLAHCRGPGPHVPGCWVVDLLLGKG